MAKDPTTLRILVVEDELLIRWSIVQALSANHHTILEAPDAQTALTLLADMSEPLDIIILDCRLPDSTGLGLLANVRRLAPNARVVLITADTTPDVIQGAIELGASAVISKPFDILGLEAVILKLHSARPGS
jgi:DNA-binding response OmpR family regulator